MDRNPFLSFFYHIVLNEIGKQSNETIKIIISLREKYTMD